VDRIEALRLFARLADRGSFSAAAKDLKIKQSTASKWVAQLESELGATLVERTTRAVHVTEAGQRLLARARDVLSAYEEMSAEFEERSREPRGQLRISVPVVFGRLHVVPAIGTFLSRFPRVTVELVMNDQYVNLVEEGFDLAVRVGVPADTSSRGRKLANSRRVLVAAPSYVKVHGTPSDPSQLRKHECLVHGEMNAAIVWRFRAKGSAEVPVSVRGRFAANNSEAVLAMAHEGLGIALLADWLVGDDLRRGRLVALLEEFATPSAPVYALTPPGRIVSAAVRAMTDHLATTLRSRLPSES
jgi:DNA-binding transcriptional LysR family regulator